MIVGALSNKFNALVSSKLGACPTCSIRLFARVSNCSTLVYSVAFCWIMLSSVGFHCVQLGFCWILLVSVLFCLILADCLLELSGEHKCEVQNLARFLVCSLHRLRYAVHQIEMWSAIVATANSLPYASSIRLFSALISWRALFWRSNWLSALLSGDDSAAGGRSFSPVALPGRNVYWNTLKHSKNNCHKCVCLSSAPVRRMANCCSSLSTGTMQISLRV